MYSVAPHRRLMEHLAGAGMRLSLPQQRILAMLCAALAVSLDCHLGALAL